TKRIEPINPGVVACLGAARILDVPQLWSRQLIERPTFGAMRAGRRRSSENLAFAAVEAGEVAACKRRPEDAVAVDIAAARSESGQGHFVNFTQRGFRWIRSRQNANDLTRVSHHGAP